MLNVVIETERLILRLFEATDLDDFYAYAKVPGVGERAGWPHHKNKEDTQQVLSAFMKHRDVLAIMHKATRKVIGSIGLHVDEQLLKDRSAKLGYVLAKPYWGQGYMSEAAKALLDYIFEENLFETIEVAHFIENDASKRIIEKLGFKFEKEGTYSSEALNKTFHSRFYRLTKEQYLKHMSNC